MSSGKHSQVTRQQLDGLCSKKKLSDDTLLEIAALAGLLAREGETHAPAEALRARARAVVAGIPDDVLDSLADEVEGADEMESEDGALDRLSAFDEVSAAFAWVGAGARVAPFAERIADGVRAFPETWAPFAAQASQLLERAAPCAGDPASRVWRAVAVSPVQRVAPAPVVVRARLSARDHTAPLGAASMPERGTWTPIASAGDWELALASGAEPGAGPILVLHGPVTQVTVQRGDDFLEMVGGPVQRALSVTPGTYVVTIDGTTSWVTVDDV